MNVSLNFSGKEKEKAKEFLEWLEKLEAKTQYEELRCRKGTETITLYASGKLLIQGPEALKTKEFILKGIGLKEERVLGFDETGRGESFGPMVVAGVLGDKNKLREVRDSKKTGDIGKASAVVSGNSLMQLTAVFNAELIDELRENGVNLNELEGKTINKFIELSRELGLKAGVKVDGQPLKEVKDKEAEFIVKGDDLDSVIGSASVIAKKARNDSKDLKKRLTWKTKEPAASG
ncbi:hypothetical protein HZB89_00295 [archaeon]|nr:hypothetical protein [archaeon]